MSNHLKDLHSIKHMFGEGQPLYYACLYPKYDWFDKEFSIEKIIEPTSTQITKTTIFPDHITNEDRFLLSRISFSNVARKYKMHIHLDIDEKFIADVYEDGNKEIMVIYENHVTVGQRKNEVEEDFYKMVISTKSDIEFDDETKIIKDDMFDTFRVIYNKASDIYPEEVIKNHDKQKKIV